MVFSIRIGFQTDSETSFINDMGVLRPTIFISIPKILKQLFNTIQAEMKSAKGCGYWFKDKCVNTKLSSLESSGSPTSFILDPVIFSKVKSMIGGKVRLMMTGGDYISAEVLKFLKISFCVDILEVYGMTETCGASCMSMMGDSV